MKPHFLVRKQAIWNNCLRDSNTGLR